MSNPGQSIVKKTAFSPEGYGVISANPSKLKDIRKGTIIALKP